MYNYHYMPIFLIKLVKILKINYMRKKTILLILFCSSIGFAQQDFVAAGGDGSGAGGSVSFSLGQTAVTEITGSNGTLSQGVQQPIEIYSLPTAQFSIDYKISLFPNPAINSITLLLDSAKDFSQLSYEMFDVTGKNLMRGKIATTETVINISDLATSTYFLNMVESGKVVKTFKIIKNN